MKLNFPYQQTKNKAEAFSRVHQYVLSDDFKQQGIEFELEHEHEQSIKASGKGFHLNARFEEQQMVVDVELSFLLKAFSKKIREKLNEDFSRLV
jgi:hypothetical protein